MNKFVQSLTALVLVLSLSFAPAMAQVDHGLSNQVGQAANQAGAAFVVGAKKIAEPFIVVGKTVVDGVSFVMLKTAQGIIYIAEDCVVGLKYVVKGAKFIIIKTADGVRWVAIEAIKAGEIVFNAVLDLAELVIEDTIYVLVKLEQGVIFVAKEVIKAGKIVINGVKYAVEVTVDGIVRISEATWNIIKKSAAWTREKWVTADIRTRLSSGLVAGAGVCQRDMNFFAHMAGCSHNSADLRKLAAASYAACKAFRDTYMTFESK
ncbi:MAG: hypothetical protein HY815_15270 [Candidatus Riflebacteria bacterium]|nr:hypothetical protein [Candidatus Riflebacteria bacterium]